jgi:phosphocarrier protein
LVAISLSFEGKTPGLDQEFIVSNKLGIHARVAAQIVQVANQFRSDLWISKSDGKVNCKSILDLLTLACPRGSKILISASGPDAPEALEALAALFQNKFGES